jgi:hypothetical protein
MLVGAKPRSRHLRQTGRHLQLDLMIKLERGEFENYSRKLWTAFEVLLPIPMLVMVVQLEYLKSVSYYCLVPFETTSDS